jgi:hypothetical protein
MSNIDRQRIAAVKVMEAMGYAFSEGDWRAPAPTAPALLDEADAMHALLVLRADKLRGCTEGSDEETDLKMISETVGAYEAKRWPDGKMPGGKG